MPGERGEPDRGKSILTESIVSITQAQYYALCILYCNSPALSMFFTGLISFFWYISPAAHAGGAPLVCPAAPCYTKENLREEGMS